MESFLQVDLLMNDCFRQSIILEAQTKDCPRPVVEDIISLWKTYEYGNDVCYHVYDREIEEENDEFKTDYPRLFEFLEEHKINKCLIHYWW